MHPDGVQKQASKGLEGRFVEVDSFTPVTLPLLAVYPLLYRNTSFFICGPAKVRLLNPGRLTTDYLQERIHVFAQTPTTNPRPMRFKNEAKDRELRNYVKIVDNKFLYIKAGTFSKQRPVPPVFVVALKDNLDYVTVAGPPTFGKPFGMSLVQLDGERGFFYIAFEWAGPRDSAEVKPDVESLSQLLHMNKFDETLLGEIIGYIGGS